MTLSKAEKDRRAEARHARAAAEMQGAGATEIGADAVNLAQPGRSGGTVTIGCKIGIAWIDLQLCKMVETWENTQTGARTIKVAQRVGDIVRIRGTSYPRGTPPAGFPERPEMVAGVALTRGVNKDWWDEWVKQHAESPYVKNSMIFAFEADANVVAKAKDIESLKSGLEPITPDTDVRIGRPSISELDKIKTSDAMRGRPAAA